jgi:hypothetical protein
VFEKRLMLKPTNWKIPLSNLHRLRRPHHNP